MSEPAPAQLARLLEGIERDGTSIMELARGGRPLSAWTIYPDELGIYDLRTKSQFYFHVHEGATHEAGHVHTVRLFPDRTAHVVAISLNGRGWPRALFTVNRWATGDSPQTPANLKRYARQFHVDEGRALEILSRVEIDVGERLRGPLADLTRRRGA